MVEKTVLVQQLDGKDDLIKVQIYVMVANVLFFCGRNTLEYWQAKLDSKRKYLDVIVGTIALVHRCKQTFDKYFPSYLPHFEGVSHVIEMCN